MTTLLIAVVGTGLALALARAGRRVEGGRRARGLGRPRRWRVPTRFRGRLERALADAALEVQPETAVELAAMGVTVSVILSLAVAPGLVPIVGVLALGAGPVSLRLARGRAERRFVAALPGGLEQVAAALRGGAAVGEALGVLSGSPALAADVHRVQARAALGLGLPDALSVWPRERPLPEVRAVAGALAVAAALGGRAADALDGLAASLRERLGALAEARALSAQARLSALVVGGAPVAYLAFSAVVDPSSVELLVGTDVGRVCLLLGVGCEVLATLWMRRILRRGTAE